MLDRLENEPDLSLTAIAHSERRTQRSVRLTLSLAFLGPALAEAAMGRAPAARLRGFGLKRLIDLLPHWPQQWSALASLRPVRADEFLAALEACALHCQTRCHLAARGERR